jgi:hypothetical protein
MKSTILVIILAVLSQTVFPQRAGQIGSAHSDYSYLGQKSASSIFNTQNKGMDDYILELFPGQEFEGWYYYWSTGGSANGSLKETPEVGWLSLNPDRFTSTGCNNIIPVMYFFQAPMTEGVYKTVIIDNNGIWDSIKVELRVTLSPEKYVRKRFGIYQDILSYKSCLRNDPFNWADNACIKDYFPADSIQYNFHINPEIDWLSISPVTAKTYRNEPKSLQNTLYMNAPDSTWVTLERDYYSFPTYYHYIIKETEPKDYMLKFNGENLITTSYYPGSSTRTMMFWVRFDGIKDQALGVNDMENHRFYLGIQRDNTLFAGMGNTYNPLTSLNLIPGKWYNMALTTSNDSAIVYINATEVSRWKYSFSGTSKANVTSAARNDFTSYGNYMKGLIEELQVWERQLSRNEIIKYMFTPPEGKENGLVIYYSFSEGWGDFTRNAVDNCFYGNLIKDPVWIDSIKRPNDPSIIITSADEGIYDGEKKLKLSSRPNPFNFSTEIAYDLPENGKIVMELYDMRGLLIGTLLNVEQLSGTNSFQLSNESLPDGIYIVKLTFLNTKGSITQSLKIIRSDLFDH